MSLSIIADDPRFVVVDKPIDLATIPERDLEAPSLRKLVEAEFGRPVWVVHRLDKEVSGLVVFAKDPDTHRALSIAFEERRVQKIYTALLHGVLEEPELTIEAPIAEFGSGRMGVRERGGKPSRTIVRRLAHHGASTLVEAHPVTGRRHQIRVHAYHAGHPIVGDLRYGDREKQGRFERLCLHSTRLVLPMDGEQPRAFESPVPEAFARIAASLTH